MIKVMIYQPDNPHHIHVYVMQEWHRGVYQYYHHDANGNLVWKDIEMGENPPVFAKIPRDIAQAFATEFIKFSGQNGIEIKTQSNVEGKLESTEKHLHDMQSIAFKLIDHLTEKP